MVCHFLSSVHRVAVITEAGARLFQGTLCVGRGSNSQVLLSVWSLLLSTLLLFSSLYSNCLPTPYPPLLTDTLIAVLIYGGYSSYLQSADGVRR